MADHDTTRYPIDAEAVGRAAYNTAIAINEVWANIREAMDRVTSNISNMLLEVPEETLALIWAVEYAPRLYYLAEYARTRRARKKNIKRIMLMYQQR